MKKRFFAAVLALAMALSLLPAAVFAVDADEPAHYSYSVKKNGTGEDLRLKNPAVVYFDDPVVWGEPTSEVISLTFKNTGNRALDIHFSGKMLSCFDVKWDSSADARTVIGVGGSAVLTIAPKADIPVDYDDSLLLMETNSRIGWSLRVDLTTTAKAVTVTPNSITKEYGETLTTHKITATVTDGISVYDMGVAFASEGFDPAAPAGRSYPITLDLSNVSGNYHVTLSGDGAVTVLKATPELVTVNATGLLTGSALSQSALTGQYRNPHTGDIVEGDFAWADGDTVMTGSGEMAYTFTPVDTDNYHSVTANVEVIVSGKTPTDIVAVESSLNATYDGKTHEVLFTVTPVERTAGLTVEYALHDTENWTYALQSDVGVYDVRASIPENNTHAAGSATAVLTIGEKPINFRLPTSGVEQALVKNKPYDGTTAGEVDMAYFAANNDLKELFVSGDDVRFNSEAITAVFASANIGLQTVTVTIDGSKALLGPDAKNYQVADTVVTSKSLIYTPPTGGGGGGSSGGSSSKPSPAPSLTPAVTADGKGEAKAAIDSKVIRDAISDAKAGKTGAIVIEPQVSGDAGKVTVELPRTSLSDVASQTEVAVTIKTALGSVTIPNGGLRELAGKSGDTVAVSVAKVAAADAVDVRVQVGQTVVDRLGSGLLVALPNLGEGNVLVAVQSDGDEVVMKKSLVDNGLANALLEGSCTVAVRDNSKEFSDVPANAWYVDTVAFASSHELFNGTADGEFSPELPMTRAMLSTVLWSLENKQQADTQTLFSDVNSGVWYAGSVQWASSVGIVNGYEDGSFRADDGVTREQMAAMLYRYAQQVGLDDSPRGSLSAFADSGDVSGWAADAMAWAVGSGLMTGRGDGVLSPAGSATRAEVAAMTERLIGLMVK